MRWKLGLLAVVLLAGCGATSDLETVPPAHAAEPQRAQLRWRESYPPSGQRLRFAVDRLEILRDGWSAEIAVTNSTRIPFELADPSQRVFGVMLFETANIDEITGAADLPPLRKAVKIEPEPPAVLAPNATWRATLSAPGSLAAGAFLRVSFGPLVARGTPPGGMEPTVVWITDKSYRL